jgi:hypothetical protein
VSRFCFSSLVVGGPLIGIGIGIEEGVPADMAREGVGSGLLWDEFLVGRGAYKIAYWFATPEVICYSHADLPNLSRHAKCGSIKHNRIT